MSVSAFALVLLLQGPVHHGSTIPSGPTAAEDWSASFTAWWDFEESAGSTALANDSTSCGSAGTDCDLSDNATVGRDATNFQEGSQSATFASASSEYFDCADGTCNELDGSGSGESITWGCWWRSGTDANQVLIENFDSAGGGKGGYQLSRISTNDLIRCSTGDQNSTYSLDGTTSSAVANDNWVHMTCRVTDDGVDSLQAVVDGALDATLSDTPETANDGEDFYIGSVDGTSNFVDGELDECFVIHDYLTDAEICRVCSCQIDGSLCTCSGATYDDNGRNDECGDCTLPACNAAAP